MSGEVAISNEASPVREFFSEMLQSEKWIVPSILMTIFLVGITLLNLSDYSGVSSVLQLLPIWIVFASILGILYYVVHCASRRVLDPFSQLTKDWRKTLLLFIPMALLILISGLNLLVFMLVKPILNQIVPFWADPMLADVDKALFFGTDPWQFLKGLNTSALALVYHRGWMGYLILAILVVAAQPSSNKKAAMIATYFALWTLAGPLIHVLLPAGGPIFYENLGYGDRFAQLVTISETANVAEYLWDIYASTGFGPGAGISAMPSMHIATCMWAILCFRAFAPKLHWASVGFAFLILCLSVALGWHYVSDGIVGAIAAVVIYAGFKAWFARVPKPVANALV